MNTTRNENSLQTAVRWAGTGLLVGGAFALLSYAMCWPLFILHAVWLTVTGQHQKRNEIMAYLASSGTMRFIYGVGGVLMLIPCFAIFCVVHNVIDPNDSLGMLRWWDKNCGNVMLWLFVYPIVGVMIFAAAVTMIGGIAQSIKATVTRTGVPQVSLKPLASLKGFSLAFYIFTTPMFIVLLMMFDTFGEEMVGYLMFCERIMVMFTVFLLFCWALPKLMVNSTRSVHIQAALIMAILMYPIYYHMLIKIGFYTWIYGEFFKVMGN